MFETLLVIQQAYVYDVNLETTLRKKKILNLR